MFEVDQRFAYDSRGYFKYVFSTTLKLLSGESDAARTHGRVFVTSHGYRASTQAVGTGESEWLGSNHYGSGLFGEKRHLWKQTYDI
jgi:hypothetical protein